MSKHIKRLAQPRRWTIPKKVATFAPKPRAGPHKAEDSLPMVVALRDVLKIATRSREVNAMIGHGDVLIDGRPCRDPRRGLGFMDLLSFPTLDEHYRVLYDTHGRIILLEAGADEAGWKLARIESKTIIKRGRTQLNLHDGRNVVVKEDEYSTGDVLKLKLPEQEIIDHYPFTEGAPAYVTGGTHIGQVAKINNEKVVKSSAPNLVELGGEASFETIRPYVFVVGSETPTLTLPEVTEHA